MIYPNYYNSSISSSIHGPLSKSSFIKERENNSGRQVVNEGPTEIIFADLTEKCKDDICFRILCNSTFILNVNKIDNKTIIKYEKIIINDKKEQIDIEKVKKNNNTSQYGIINDKYNKFLSIIEFIENTIENDYKNDFPFKVTIYFNEINIQSSIFNLNCNYILEIPGKDINEYNNEFSDKNIFNKKIKDGLLYLINEVNKNY